MGWLIKHLGPSHHCPIPGVMDFNGQPTVGLGSKWQCDECGVVYVFDSYIAKTENDPWVTPKAIWSKEEE